MKINKNSYTCFENLTSQCDNLLCPRRNYHLHWELWQRFYDSKKFFITPNTYYFEKGKKNNHIDFYMWIRAKFFNYNPLADSIKAQKF